MVTIRCLQNSQISDPSCCTLEEHIVFTGVLVTVNKRKYYFNPNPKTVYNRGKITISGFTINQNLESVTFDLSEVPNASWNDIKELISNCVGCGCPEIEGATWGFIEGTLSDQTDLQSVLDLKYDANNPSGFIDASGAPIQSVTGTAVTGTPSDPIINLQDLSNYLQNGDNVSQLINDIGYLIANQLITISGDATGSGTTSIVLTIAPAIASKWTTNGADIYRNSRVGIGVTAPTQQLDISGNLQIPNTTNADLSGIIYKNGVPFFHNFSYGNNGTVTPNGSNLFIGNAGNFTMGSSATLISQASRNTGIGQGSLGLNTTGYENLAIGQDAMQKNETGNNNVAIGIITLRDQTIGIRNVAIGNLAMVTCVSTQGNVAIGFSSQITKTSGNLDIAIGFESGRYIANGSSANSVSENSVYLGAATKALASGQTNQIVIGHNAIGAGSNSVVLGNDNITTTLLKGNVGIGLTTAPTARLQVRGTSTTTGEALRVSNSTPTPIIQAFNNQRVEFNGNQPVRLPRLTMAQRNALTGVQIADEIYCTDATANDASVGVKQVWNGSTWKSCW